MTEALEMSQSHLLLGSPPKVHIPGRQSGCTLVGTAFELVEARGPLSALAPHAAMSLLISCSPLAPAWLLQRVLWERPRRGICAGEGAVGALCQDRCSRESQSPGAPHLPRAQTWEGVTAKEQLSKTEPQTLVRRLASRHDSFSPSVKISEVREII